MESARKPATYADLLAMPDGVRAEVVAGEVVTQPAPLPKHSRIARSIGTFVGKPFDDDDGHGGPGGWWILPDVDVELTTHDIVRPDVAGLRRERLPSPWDTRPIVIAPDWICEILSPSNARHDRVVKAALYAGSRVPFFWLIDAAERIVEAFELNPEGAWLRLGAWGDGQVARIRPFEAISIEITRLFPPLPG